MIFQHSVKGGDNITQNINVPQNKHNNCTLHEECIFGNMIKAEEWDTTGLENELADKLEQGRLGKTCKLQRWKWSCQAKSYKY